MLKKSNILLLIAFIGALELVIYLWAMWTTEPEFVFDKCARNSGRASSLINLSILLIAGYYGFRKIWLDERKRDMFRILITLFAVNHLVHFFYVFQNFRHHSWVFSVPENLHGFITFIFILAVPVFLWLYQRLNTFWFVCITIHLINVSYFIMKTFYSKVQPEHPAYHNQLGIVVTSLAILYIIYGFFRSYGVRSQ